MISDRVGSYDAIGAAGGCASAGSRAAKSNICRNNRFIYEVFLRADHPKRSTAKGVKSMLVGRSSTNSLTRRPVPAPRLSPSIECPVATTTLLYRRILPIYGNPSAEQRR